MNNYYVHTKIDWVRSLLTLLTSFVCVATSANDCNTNPLFSTTTNNLTISFSDESVSDCDIVSWQWNLGDGATSSLQHPIHTYPFPSTYHVCLTIIVLTDDGQYEEHVTCQEVVLEDALPCSLNAEFDFNIDNNGSVVLSANCIAGFFTTIDSLTWSLGDGNMDVGEIASHTYSESGMYDVCLTAHGSTDLATCQNIQCEELEISIVLPIINAAFEIKSADHCRVVPKVTSLPVENVEVVGHRWELSDGRVFYGDQPDIELLENGDLEICLIEECWSLGQYQEFAACQTIEVECVNAQVVQVADISVERQEIVQDRLVEITRFPQEMVLRSTSKENVVVKMFDVSGRLFHVTQLPALSLQHVEVPQKGLVIIQTITPQGQVAVHRSFAY